MPTIPAPARFFDVPIHPVSPASLVDALVEWGSGSRLRRICYVNVHAMNLAADDPEFRAALQTADVVFCDGFGVLLGARILGHELPHRMTPPDWIDAFGEAAAAAGQSVFALGDEDGVAMRFQAAMERDHPGYRSAGSHHGFFAKTGPENDAVVEQINASGAHHLLVGLGMPLQERWLVDNADRLRVRTALAVGALFRWRSGAEARGPRWMTDHGLEWLDRLVHHPVRHFRRYAIGNPRFLARVLRERMVRRS